jgi:hypothetical protein
LYAVMACVLLGPGVAATIVHKLFGVWHWPFFPSYACPRCSLCY